MQNWRKWKLYAHLHKRKLIQGIVSIWDTKPCWMLDSDKLIDHGPVKWNIIFLLYVNHLSLWGIIMPYSLTILHTHMGPGEDTWLRTGQLEYLISILTTAIGLGVVAWPSLMTQSSPDHLWKLQVWQCFLELHVTNFPSLEGKCAWKRNQYREKWSWEIEGGMERKTERKRERERNRNRDRMTTDHLRSWANCC